MLDVTVRETVKATAPVLAEHGLTITRHFYARMFEHNPELKNIFNQSHQAVGDQPQALANAVYAYAENIDAPERLESAIRRITHKHASLGVTPEQYDVVGHHLLASIREVLGEAATDEILHAWEKAYDQLAGLLIDEEARLYREAAEAVGGWTGWQDFKVVRKAPESSEITSFYLRPADGGPVPHFSPGQYVSVNVRIPELNLLQPRQYSLSDAPNGDYLRISVKRESGHNGAPAGKVSMLLHQNIAEGDLVSVSPPFGEFRLDESSDKPVLLVSGGVGLTPMMGILKQLLSSQRQVLLVHGARDGDRLALWNEVREVTAASESRMESMLFLEDTSGSEDWDHQGQVDLATIAERLPADPVCYLCGPLPFTRMQRRFLREHGVADRHIHHEVFGSDILEP